MSIHIHKDIEYLITSSDINNKKNENLLSCWIYNN